MKGFVVGGFVGILTMVFACLMGYFGCSFSCYSDFGSLRSVYDKISHPDVTYGKQYPKYFDKTVKLLDSNPASFAIADMFELAETSQEESVSVLIGASNLGTSFALSKYIMEKSVKPLFVFYRQKKNVKKCFPSYSQSLIFGSEFLEPFLDMKSFHRKKRYETNFVIKIYICFII
eukprot:TRINITY_DN486_c1_g1_i4.p1 TRINITY_DN486_c1_g1~~TRINITY_DN486_c1_g1_i4.p1  ORF type:complete len:175 (-),score=9.21 TRINITY_DN486_c1_g1_i4:396-920(-)